MEYLCDDPLSAAAAMIGELARFATRTAEGERVILVIEATGHLTTPFRVWTGTISVPGEKGGQP